MRIVITILLVIIAYHTILLWLTKRRLIRAASPYLTNPRDSNADHSVRFARSRSPMTIRITKAPSSTNN
jgi:hypothetical protein